MSTKIEAMRLAAEFGFRAAERGDNLQMMLSKFDELHAEKPDTDLLKNIFSVSVRRNKTLGKKIRKQRSDKGFTTKQLAKLQIDFKDKINDITDEREGGDGVWIYLKAGWHNCGSHLIHEWDYKMAVAELERVEKCACRDCTQPESI